MNRSPWSAWGMKAPCCLMILLQPFRCGFACCTFLNRFCVSCPTPSRRACRRSSFVLPPHCRPLPPFHINTPASTPCVFQPSLLNSHFLLLLILTAPFDISYCFLLQSFQLFVALALPATFSVSCHIWRQLARSKRGGSGGARHSEAPMLRRYAMTSASA